MPLDAVCLTGIVRELQDTIVGLRIEKIQQPSRDQVVLTLRGNRKLLLCASANQPRIHLTTVARENPIQAPMFCMLLRKHLGSGRISTIEQPALERVVRLTVDMVDEMGEIGQRQLVLEKTSLQTSHHRNMYLTEHVTQDFIQRQAIFGILYLAVGEATQNDACALG